jgi:hypothetical protein
MLQANGVGQLKCHERAIWLGSVFLGENRAFVR